MSTSTATAPATHVRSPLSRLYFARFAFAIVWAGLLFTTASTLGPLGITLLVLYPLFDVAAAITDARTSTGTRPVRLLYANIAISLLAAAGLVVATSSGIPDVLRVWGGWAIVSGLVQLGVAITRRTQGGQWPMIASGAISAVAGTAFILQAGAAEPSLTNLAGYAALGGIFFLVSALRQGRTTES